MHRCLQPLSGDGGAFHVAKGKEGAGWNPATSRIDFSEPVRGINWCNYSRCLGLGVMIAETVAHGLRVEVSPAYFRETEGAVGHQVEESQRGAKLAVDIRLRHHSHQSTSTPDDLKA